MENWIMHRPKKFEYAGRYVRNWFSNFAESPIIIDDIIYKSVENYYQAQKTTDKAKWVEISSLTPSESKKAGKKLHLREDWEDVKYDIMKKGLLAKFTQNEEQKEKLLSTEDETLVEWNNWGDKIWGVTIDDNIGQNLLGIALMEIRTELQKTATNGL